MNWTRCCDALPPPPEDIYEYYGPKCLTYNSATGAYRIAQMTFFAEPDESPNRFSGWQTDGEGWDIEPTHWAPLTPPPGYEA